jgi:hypothetical protein
VILLALIALAFAEERRPLPVPQVGAGYPPGTAHVENGLRCFFCGDRDVPAHQHGIDIVPGGGFVVYETPPTKPGKMK